MEIGNLSSSPAISYFPKASAGDGVAERARTIPRNSTGASKGQTSVESAATGPARNNSIETAHKDLRESGDIEKANVSAISSVPRIQFKDSEGTRVMEVYDSKNILIYQVPPKGQLTLIRSRESHTNPQVETSA